MIITDEKKQEIIYKTKILDEAQLTLKKEFIGIDNIIEQLINSIKPYYFFSEFLKKPLVINIWGLTGTGKTSIITRLCELIDLKNKLFKFDSGEYVGSDYLLKSEINEKLSRLTERNIVLMFDEFQLCRTIGTDGREIDRIGLRPLWELIDSGTAYTYRDYSPDITDLYKVLTKLMDTEITIENGIVVGGESIYKSFSERSNAKPCDYNLVSDNSLKNSEEYFKSYGTSKKFDGRYPYFMKYNWIVQLVGKNPAFFKNTSTVNKENVMNWNTDWDLNDMKNTLKHFRSYFDNMSVKQIREIVKNHFLSHSESMRKLDFSQSLIFCVGNLDDAYIMSHTINPDSDADLFHQHSLKITIPKIKEALANRFRMEQIGRLGNNHIIYPSLRRIDYVNIIKLYLNQRIELFQNEYAINIEFTKKLETIIYKESVFPTQGVRPVLSTLNNQIDSYMSRIISDILIESNYTSGINNLVWDYNGKKNIYEISAYVDKKLIFKKEYPIILLVEKLRKSDQSEDQAYTAIHEAGHAIVSIYGSGLIPKEIVSRTASSGAKGFCSIDFPDILTKESLLKEVMILYGGIEAERLIFGDDYTSTGADSDLTRATNRLVSYFKNYGMGDVNLKVSSITDSTMNGSVLYDDSYEEHIKKLSKELREATLKLLEEHKDSLLMLGEVLSKKSKLTTKQIKTILDLSNVSIRNKENYYSFKAKIKQHSDKLKPVAKVLELAS